MIEERTWYEGYGVEKWQARRQYVYGDRYIDERLTLDLNATPGQDNECESRYRYHEDRNWNVAQVTGQGVWEAKFNYTPYGEYTKIAERSGGSYGATGNPYFFQERYWDADAELYYFRNRWYHPKLGRFLQRDPSGYEDGMNLYEFVRGRPLVGQDPSGAISVQSSTTVGEECVYTGESRADPRVVRKRRTTKPIEELYPTIVEFLVIPCECLVCCKDYDLKVVWSPVRILAPGSGPISIGYVPSGVVWVRSPSGDYSDSEVIEEYRDYRTFEDYRKDQRFAAKAWGEAAGKLLARGMTEQDEEDTRKLLEDLLGKAWKKWLEKLQDESGAIQPEELWKKVQEEKIKEFKKKCEDTCRSRKGSSY